MDEKDFTITNEDLTEIFGDKLEKNLKGKENHSNKESTKKIEIKKEPSIEIEEKYEIDDLIKKAEKIQSQLTEKNIEVESLSFQDFLKEDIISELLESYDFIRVQIAKSLSEIVDEKVINKMLLKTLEKSALNSFVLRKTNWNSQSSRLNENGKIDIEQFIKNITVYQDEIKELDKEIKISLTNLLYLRLKAIKSGISEDFYQKVKLDIMDNILILENAYNEKIIKLLNEIAESSFKKIESEGA